MVIIGQYTVLGGIPPVIKVRANSIPTFLLLLTYIALLSNVCMRKGMLTPNIWSCPICVLQMFLLLRQVFPKRVIVLCLPNIPHCTFCLFYSRHYNFNNHCNDIAFNFGYTDYIYVCINTWRIVSYTRQNICSWYDNKNYITFKRNNYLRIKIDEHMTFKYASLKEYHWWFEGGSTTYTGNSLAIGNSLSEMLCEYFEYDHI